MFGGQSNSTAPKLLKFEPPKDPYDEEKKKKAWEMPSWQKSTYIEKKFEERERLINNNTALNRDDKLAAKTAMQVYLQQIRMQEWDSEADECYIREFRDFLQGKSKYNTDPRYAHLVPWKKNALIGRDIDAYIDAIIDKKISFDAKIAKLFATKMAPRNLQDAWLYYVFIVTGKRPPTDLFLKAWDAFYPYEETPRLAAGDTPQKEWVKTPERAAPRENQKGIDGPLEACEEIKTDTTTKPHPGQGVDPKELEQEEKENDGVGDIEQDHPPEDQKPPKKEKDEEEDYFDAEDGIKKEEPKEEEEKKDETPPKIKEEPKDIEEEEKKDKGKEPDPLESNETSAQGEERGRKRDEIRKRVSENLPGQEGQVDTFYVSYDGVAHLNAQHTQAPQAQDAITRAQKKIKMAFVDAAKATGTQAKKLWNAVEQLGFRAGYQITRIRGVDLIPAQHAAEMLENVKNERESAARLLEAERKKLSDKEFENNKLKTLYEELRVTLADKNKRLDALMAQSEMWQNMDPEVMQEELKVTKDQLKEMQISYQDLKRSEDKLKQLTEEKDRYIEELNNTRKQLEEKIKSNPHKKLVPLVKVQQQQLDEVKKELGEAKRELENAIKNRDPYVRGMSERIRDLTHRYAKLSRDYLGLRKENETMHATQQRLQEAITQQGQQLEAKEQEILLKARQNQILGDAALRNEEEKGQMLKELEEERTKLAQAREDLTKTVEEMMKLQQDHEVSAAEWRAKMEELESKLIQSQGVNVATDDLVDELRQTVENLSQPRPQNEVIEEQIEVAQEEVNRKRRRIVEDYGETPDNDSNTRLAQIQTGRDNIRQTQQIVSVLSDNERPKRKAKDKANEKIKEQAEQGKRRKKR